MECLDLFKIFKAYAWAHCKSEEYVLYALVENPSDEPQQAMQHFAFESYQIHDLMDFLMKEMGQEEEASLQWRAQLKVLGDLLERHFQEEERDFFPHLDKFMDENQALELGQKYILEREALFKKKSGKRFLYEDSLSAQV